MRARAIAAALLVSTAAALGACGGDEESVDTKPTTTTAAACERDSLSLVNAGKLTIATDKPAYSPYFEDDDPSNGKGFESAVAYAIADELGFKKSEVEWTVVPFNAAFKPGDKDWDFDVNQFSITEDRKKAVDFSAPYFSAPQAVLALKSSPAAKATTLAELKDSKLGVQVGTASLEATRDAIAPSQDPQVFNDSNDVVPAIKSKRVEAVVLDLPTALYLAAAELEDATVVGQFEAEGGDDWGAVLAKDSELTPCVDAAIERLRSSGELEALTEQWITKATGARELS